MQMYTITHPAIKERENKDINCIP